MQPKLDPTLKRIGVVLRERSNGIVHDPLPPQLTGLLMQLGGYAPTNMSDSKTDTAVPAAKRR
jgi:hypothetical protein